MVIVSVCAYGVGNHLSVSWAVSGPLYPIGVVHAFSHMEVPDKSAQEILEVLLPLVLGAKNAKQRITSCLCGY